MKNDKKGEPMSLLIVKGLPFFRKVPAKILDLWLRTFQPVTKNYAKGTIVNFQGEPYTELLFILSGEVVAEIQDYNGKVLKVETLKAPDPIATAILFASDNSLPVTTIAKTEVKILIIPKNQVLRLCRLSEDFLQNLLADMGGKLTFLAQKLRFLQFGTIRQKIAGFLLDEMRKQKTASLQVPYTKEVLSEIFGVTRPAFSRVFSELCKEKIIRQKKGVIQVLNAVRLKEMLTEQE